MYETIGRRAMNLTYRDIYECGNKETWSGIEDGAGQLEQDECGGRSGG